MLEKLNTIIKKFKLGFLDNFSLSHGQTLIILSLVLLLSFILRVYRLEIESIVYDEAFTISVANENIFKLIERVAADDNPPLHYIMLHFWIKMFGYGEYSVRFISVISGVLSVYVLYRVGRLIFNEEIGIISAFILSISLFNIRYSQEARFYSLLTLVVLISNYYFIKILNERNWKHVAGYIISTIAICYTHVFGLFYIIFQNVYYLLIFRKNIKFWIKIQCAILLLFLPWLFILINQTNYIINHGGATAGHGSIAHIPQPSLTIIINTFKLFASNYTSLYLFIILVIIGMVAYKYKILSDVNDKIFLLLWLFVPIVLSVVISLIVLPIYAPKYVIASIPALILLVSKGIFNFRKNIIVLTILVILILSTFPSLERYYSIYEKDQWRNVVDHIEQNGGNNDFILLYKSSSKEPFEYYYKNDSNFKVFKEEDVKNFTKYDGIWLIFSHVWSPEAKNGSILIENTLAKTHTLQYSIFFAGVQLSHWHMKNNMTNMTISMDINVKDPEDEIADGVLIEIRDKKNASIWWVHTKDWKMPANDTYKVNYDILTDVDKNVRIDIPAVKFQSYFGYMPARYEFTILSNTNGGSHINFSIDNIKIWDNNYTYFEENFDSESSLKRFNLKVKEEENKRLKMQHNISIINGRLNMESFNGNYGISIIIPPNYLWSENDNRSY